MGTCPKCDAEVAAVNANAVQIEVSGGVLLKGVSYFCPKCSCVLGVSFDPLALRADIVSQVLKGISDKG